MSEILLRRSEVEKLFKLKSRNTLTDWKKRGVLIPQRIGGLDYYRQSDIDALLKKEHPCHETDPLQI